jgi:dihydropyrimidinase
MAFDTIIQGGTVATASDTFACDVGIADGRIAALGHDLGDATQTIDATGRLVLPGGIDSHVHFSQPSGPGIVMADDFESGTRAAAFGGNTTVLPFCLQERGQSLRQAVRDYHAKADGNCYIDVSFHLIISDPTEQVLAIEETASEPALAGRMLPELAKRLMPTPRDTLFTTPDKHQDVAD